MSETPKNHEVQTPKTEASKDFKQLVVDSIHDKRITQTNRQEIIKLVNQMDQEKVKVHQDTINDLKKFAKENGYTGFSANLEKSLQSAGQKASTKPVESWVSTGGAGNAPSTAPEPEKKEPDAAPEPEKKEEPKKEEPKKEEPKKEGTSTMDKVGNFFTGKLDLNSLPKEDQAAIKDLQDAGFRFKPVEGKTGEYSVDMNGLADKSKIDLAKKTFTTDMLKKDGKDFSTEFKDTQDAKDKMTKANSLINTMSQLSPLEKIYDTHRTSQEQDQYQKLNAQKVSLEQDLGIAAPAPKAAGAEGGK